MLISEMPLPTLPVEQPAFWADPFSFVETARKQHPWLARFSAGYIVHGYQASKDLMMMDDRLVPGFGGVVELFGARGTLWGRFMDEMILSRAGTDHTRLRASVADAFTPRAANQSRPMMRKVITELLDEWVPKGHFDFALFASYFPVTVICGLLGVSAEPIPRMRAALDGQLASLTLDRSLLPALEAGFRQMWDFADTLVLEREKKPAQEGGLVEALIAAKQAGRMDEDELRFMILVVLIAGYDTSKNLFTLTMYLLLNRPDIWARCAEDRAYSGKVIDEMLRYSSIASPYRGVREPFEYDGVTFTPDAMLVFGLPLAGRDPADYPDPKTFDPERASTNRHVAFGRGAHICLGQFIAKAQLEEGLHLVAQRIKNPRLAGEIAWRPFLGAWGLRTLPIAFDAAPGHTAEPTRRAG